MLELGPGYDDEVVDSLLATIDERLAWLAAVVWIAVAYAAGQIMRYR